MIDSIINSTLLLAVPLVLAALGGAIHRRAGVVNIGLEGQMLVGAFSGIIASTATGSWLVGILVGGIGGALAGLVMSLVITRLSANEIIVGLGFNIVALGIVGFTLRAVYGVSGTLRFPDQPRLPRITIPGLDEVPILGAIFSGKDVLFWFAVLLVPFLAWAFANTRWGIRTRATGVSESATASLGVRTLGLRDAAGTIAGMLAGLGGVALALGVSGLFNENMIAGRGFVALAAFYFGRSRPLPTALACLLFSFFDALQIRLQTSGGFPSDLIQTLPYIAVVAVLAWAGYTGLRRRTRMTA
ncbi:simple sugar transport system permease protein [Leucobacter luti]|uniref:ABC transporter permease n=1 Tax=Leucobacter luti TaxID=340320 RepID=UPI001045FB41|nr:ABC transporter permease [Leucobacter luti]MCW2288133.1 simple sugar transport system permease protein [Leucobacter luti]TCK45705.1 simple sugar transport system permease protein [Leucobacter luti]